LIIAIYSFIEYNIINFYIGEYQMSLLSCVVSRDLARHLREQDRRAVLADAEEDLAERLQDDEAWVWENLGDLDQGAGVRDQAVLAVAKAVIAARPNNPALSYALRKLALQEAKRQIRDRISKAEEDSALDALD
jgi:hypothetical protein